jgi:hypothetical protein
MIICLCLLFAGRASAQWVVSDPGNLAQGIINASKNIIHTSKTATLPAMLPARPAIWFTLRP